MPKPHTLIAAALIALVSYSVPALGASPAAQTQKFALELVSPNQSERLAALDWFKTRGKKDAIPALIQALRFTRTDRREIVGALEALAGESAGDTWHQWMLWQEKHAEVKPFAGFAGFKAALYARIDPAFSVFLHAGVKHEIRLEEIAWGGVVKDGIPALTNPKLLPAREAGYLTGDELVFGVSINGDARAYPLRILDWHEMFNDVIGGVPVSLAYCTLCGSGILFETTVKGREKPFVFGSSGFLYRSNKLMYDTATNSLWNQFTGRPVVGKLTGSGIELKTRPVTIASWAEWLKSNPGTKVTMDGTVPARMDWPILYGVRRGGRWVVIYSPLDVNCGIGGQPCPRCLGYSPIDARTIAANVLIDAASRRATSGKSQLLGTAKLETGDAGE